MVSFESIKKLILEFCKQNHISSKKAFPLKGYEDVFIEWVVNNWKPPLTHSTEATEALEDNAWMFLPSGIPFLEKVKWVGVCSIFGREVKGIEVGILKEGFDELLRGIDL